jgi:hypothetical protein
MNFKVPAKAAALAAALAVLVPARAFGLEIFIHHPGLNRTSVASEGKIVLHGEAFAYFLSPSNFPSYNDLSGRPDKWNFGFQNFFPITRTTTLMAQLVTHDDGGQRTKFDWHFHLRQLVVPYLAAYICHDSDHDAEHQSYFRGKPYYTNRNYIGIGIPVEGRNFLIEPFTWFFHHTNQRVFLDMSGEKLRQEYGLRASAWTGGGLSAHLQVVFRTDTAFSLGQDFLGELVIRAQVASWLQLSLGGTLWTDLKTGAPGRKPSYHKIMWGVAIPF